MIYLPRCAAEVLSLAGENTRYNLAGVRLQELAEGWFRMEATDGRRLGILRGCSSPTMQDESAASRLPPPESILLEGVLLSDDLARAFKILEKGRQLGIMLSSPSPSVVAGDTCMNLRLADGRFPDVDSALPKNGALFGLKVNPTFFMDVLRVARAVAASGDFPEQVEILYFGQGEPVGIICKGGRGLTFDGIIMPLAESKPIPQAPQA